VRATINKGEEQDEKQDEGEDTKRRVLSKAKAVDEVDARKRRTTEEKIISNECVLGGYQMQEQGGADFRV
jgi:hypothetical protein